jgi:hypothetical protein
MGFWHLVFIRRKKGGREKWGTKKRGGNKDNKVRIMNKMKMTMKINLMNKKKKAVMILMTLLLVVLMVVLMVVNFELELL